MEPFCESAAREAPVEATFRRRVAAGRGVGRNGRLGQLIRRRTLLPGCHPYPYGGEREFVASRSHCSDSPLSVPMSRPSKRSAARSTDRIPTRSSAGLSSGSPPSRRGPWPSSPRAAEVARRTRSALKTCHPRRGRSFPWDLSEAQAVVLVRPLQPPLVLSRAAGIAGLGLGAPEIGERPDHLLILVGELPVLGLGLGTQPVQLALELGASTHPGLQLVVPIGPRAGVEVVGVVAHVLDVM